MMIIRRRIWLYHAIPKWSALLCALFFSFSAHGLEAQGTKLIPQVGLFAPLRNLGVVQTPEGTLRLGKKTSSLAWGVATEFGGSTPIGFRAGILFGTSSEISVRGPGCANCETEVKVRVITGTLVLRPFRSYAGFTPYLLAGGGFKRYGLNDGDLKEFGIEDAVDDQTNRTLQLGGGASFSLGVTQVLFEISDFISGFDVEEGMGNGNTQHDFFLTVGLRL